MIIHDALTPADVMKHQPDLLTKLISLQGHGPDEETLGICSNADVYSPIIGTLAARWPKYSGSPLYPVPYVEEIDEDDAVDYDSPANWAYDNFDNLWDSTTQYGSDRWELLAWLIEQLASAKADMITAARHGVSPETQGDTNHAS